MTAWLFMGPQHTLTYSAASTATLAVGMAAFMGLLWLKGRGTLISVWPLTFMIIFIILYGTITPIIGRLSIIDISSILERNESLTGSGNLGVLSTLCDGKPILGHGFGGFWTEAMRRATSSHAHNGYLDIILHLGLMGHFLFSMFLLSSCKKAQMVMKRDFFWGSLWFCYLLMGVIHNIVETSIFEFTGPMAAILLFMQISSIDITSNHQKLPGR
jgi:O-antigen ligase